MIKKTKLLLFILAVLAQLAVPSWLIHESENILSAGTRYKFKTEPVDPEDAFRGKYVALAFSANYCFVDFTQMFQTNQKAFAIIHSDNSEFASVSSLSRTKPVNGEYIKVKIISQNGQYVKFRYPFERYFLEEDIAERVEKLYREHNVRGKQDTYIVVRVRNGNAIIEDLIIGGMPVNETLKNDQSDNK